MMKKRHICRTATVLLGLLALIFHVKSNELLGGQGRLAGAVLGLLGAIFGTQWLAYQQRHDATSAHPGTPAWLRRLLFSSLLGFTVITATAQTTWTATERSPHVLGDVAYGAGRYVAVGDYGLIQTSTDGAVWTNQAISKLEADGFASIVYANGRFVMVGRKGRIMTSTTGLTWVKYASGTAEALRDLTYGGGKFVAVGWNGVILTSTDGKTWAKQVSGTTYAFSAITYGGGQFVAVGQSGLLMTSPDGMTWTPRPVLVSGFDLWDVTTGPNGSFVAVGGLTVVLTSTDGVTWTYRTIAGPATQLVGIAYNPVQGRYVAVSNEGSKTFGSADGINWQAGSSGTRLGIYSVQYIQGQFLALGEEVSIQTSLNGITWRPLTISHGMSLHGAAFGNGRYVAVGAYWSNNYALTANVAVTSTDGLNYAIGETVHLPNSAKRFTDVAFGNGLFVAVGEDAVIQTSTDGKVWDLRQVLAGKQLNAVTFGGGQFVAIGPNSFLCRSVDGKTWNQGFTGPGVDYKGLTFANGLFVAVGTSGAIATSSNGIIWTPRPSGTTKQLKSVAFGNGMWLAVGYDGVACRSLNGTTWTSFTVDANAQLNHVTFANGQFVAAGLDGKMFTFPNVFIWTARASNTAAHLWSIMHGPNQFVAVGESAALDDWTSAITITSPDNSGPAVNAQPTSPLDTQARLATEGSAPEIRLQAISYPNPVVDDFTVALQGVSGQAVRLWVVDMAGHTVSDKQINVGEGQHQEPMSLGQHQPGMYLLRVSTADQTQTLKLQKQ